MVEYVRGSQNDKWHWCENCTQYPLFIYQKTTVRQIDLCEQCKAKEENGNCQCVECGTIEEPKIVREIPVFL